MLRFLGVRNLSVIEHLEAEFEPGFNVLTGETGAGKSVLVEAIDLLAGGRATADLIRTGEPQAIVQAIFESRDGREVIVRREISSQGRSRAFIDDALATTTALRELGESLLELHGQHQHQALLDPAEHLDVLDAYAGHAQLRETTAARYGEWRAVVDALDRTRISDQEKRARTEIATFQLQEIEKVSPAPGEDETLANEKRVLANVDKLQRLSTEAYGVLYDGEHAVLAGLSAAYKRVAELAALDERFLPFLEQRDGVKAGLDDLAFFLRRYSTELEGSPDRLQAVEDRLAAIERVKRRYGPALADVLAKHASLREELEALGATEERAAALVEQERVTRAAFCSAATELSESRKAAGTQLAKTLHRDLRELAMPACRIEVRQRRLEDTGSWSARGVDEVEFYLSPNPGEDLRPLARIASGGELSRIMLALRIATTGTTSGRTLIFDEVDAGIGGAAADAVGTRLQQLGRNNQVLCVTHLAQIAARAMTHFEIAKRVESGRTVTSLTKLDESQREAEIGRMIAGASVSPQVLASAREMLKSRLGEHTAKGESEGALTAKAKGKRGGR